ncbi:MAG: glycosyltransferase [Deltaproteobacteria bacterium]|nr:glycosyltransferase [Deltaproteobacteria bacterium]
MTKPPLLSLCMIVRDEEAMLPRCLGSVRKYVDEIIVVDTGSKDRTVQIAEEYGAKVFNHKWEGDFSKHRNQAIGYAKGKWTLVLDADEELKNGSGEILRQAIQHDEIDSIELTNISFFNKGSSEAWVKQIRIFKNSPEVYYSDIVHEQIMGLKNTKRFPIFVNHYGYDLGEGISEKKHKRNVRLLQEQIKREPDNFFYHLNLSVSYSTHFEYSKAVNEGLTALRLARGRGLMDDNVLWAHYIVSSAYLKLDDLDNAEKYASIAADASMDHLDSRFILALVFHRKKDWKKLIDISSELLQRYNLLNDSPEKLSSRFIHMANEEWRVHIALGDMHLHQNNIERANTEFKMAKSLSANPDECDQIIGDCLRKKEYWQQAKDHYRSSLAINEDNSNALFGMALVHKALNDIEKYRELISKIDENKIQTHDFFFEKGLINLKDKEYDASIKHFNHAISLKPDAFHAYQNLALAYKYNGNIKKAVEICLKAIELKPESKDSRINLGYLFYETHEFKKSKEMLESALLLDQNLMEIRILLCEINLMTRDIERCVYECDWILKNLGHPLDMTINSLSDLAGIFLIIAQILAGKKDNVLSEKAVHLARQLDPKIEEKIEMTSN